MTEIWSADILEQFYEADKECITLVPVFVSTVPTDTIVTQNDEHDAYEWVSCEKANTMFSFPGQQKAPAAVKAEFVDKAPNQHLKIEMNGKGGRYPRIPQWRLSKPGNVKNGVILRWWYAADEE